MGKAKEKIEKATLAGGCFWCLEAAYKRLKGVIEVIPAYAGGEKNKPTYKEVCAGNTGHAEVIQISFNPDVIYYKDLLEIFFFLHDPTTLNRQGADIGTQYRSAIFYHNTQQKEIAENLIKKLETERVFHNHIVTEVTEIDTFYPAEDYHIDYYNRNKGQSYCNMVISPKLAKFRKKYQEKLLKD